MKMISILLLLLSTATALVFLPTAHAKLNYRVTLCIHDTWICNSSSVCQTGPDDSCFERHEGPITPIPTTEAYVQENTTIKSIAVRCLADGQVMDLEVYENPECGGSPMYTHMSSTGVCVASDDLYYSAKCDLVPDSQPEQTGFPDLTNDQSEEMMIRACYYGPLGCNTSTPTCEEMPDHSCFKGPSDVFDVESITIHCMEGGSYLAELHNDPQCVDEPFYPMLGETNKCNENDVFSYSVECFIQNNTDIMRSPPPYPYQSPTSTTLPETSPVPYASPSMEPLESSPTPSQEPIPSEGIVDDPVSTSSPLLACFPADATVRSENGNVKRMDQLDIGDRVMAGKHEYSSIYLFGHRLVSGMFDFVQISIANGKKIELSEGHLLLSNNHLVRADKIKLGDMLFDVIEGRTYPVTNIQTIHKLGLYNPHTMQGDIVVNDIQASSYTNVVHPSLAHMLLLPERLVYMLSHGYSILGSSFESHTPKWLSIVLDTSNTIRSVVAFP